MLVALYLGIIFCMKSIATFMVYCGIKFNFSRSNIAIFTFERKKLKNSHIAILLFYTLQKYLYLKNA
jgi:hypothetical protein